MRAEGKGQPCPAPSFPQHLLCAVYGWGGVPSSSEAGWGGLPRSPAWLGKAASQSLQQLCIGCRLPLSVRIFWIFSQWSQPRSGHGKAPGPGKSTAHHGVRHCRGFALKHLGVGSGLLGSRCQLLGSMAPPHFLPWLLSSSL